MTEQELDQFVEARLSAARAAQEAFRAARGRYWQGVETPGVAPGAPDLAARPTDQAESWGDVVGPLSLPAEWDVRLRVDVYDGPAGKGWTLTASTAGRRRTWAGAGPEAGRATPWVDVPTEVIS
jgi:hypothetical protein